MVLLYIIISVLIIYTWLMGWYWMAWRSIPAFSPATSDHSPVISVIIPARNEEENIGRLLTGLKEQDYPADKIEIIVTDDHSTDNTVSVVRGFAGIKLVSLQETLINSYKKKALEAGIAAATGTLIVTTDADCLPPKNWLKTIAAFKEQTNAVFIAAPVSIDGDSSLVQVFQSMDFLVLQGITGAAVQQNKMSMCNGANLAYERDAFYAVNGFDGIDDIASGDDMLLMHKIAGKYPGRLFYLRSKEAIVSTRPVKSWREFFSQRIRWASKALHYDDKRILPVLLLVYLLNLAFPVLLVMSIINHYYWNWFFGFWLAKTFVELPFFIAVTGFFDKRWMIKLFLFFQPLHIFYTLTAGLFGQFGSYQWKGRKVK